MDEQFKLGHYQNAERRSWVKTYPLCLIACR
jgi:hypothetical protein